MKKQCPDCPDGYVWESTGPTDLTCPTCGGFAFVEDYGLPALAARDAVIAELVGALEEVLIYVNNSGPLVKDGDITYPGPAAFRRWYAVIAKHARASNGER